MQTDDDIKRDAENELKWTPDIDETDIAVKVNECVVTLTGFTKSLFEKYRAERAVRCVEGVTAVANDIEVRLPGSPPSDPEIARAAAAALRSGMSVTCDDIRPMVHGGHVTLLGTVQWHYQRELAERLMHGLSGVISVRNSLHIKPVVAVGSDVKERIEAAFQRLAQLDASRIKVEAEGSEVTLRGEVRSLAEHDQAQSTAWSAPGVTRVRNELSVRS
jgi:osmotically-inducible protein OsmY